MDYNRDKNWPLHWLTKTRADNPEPGVYSHSAGTWQTLSGLINAWQTGTTGDANIQQLFLPAGRAYIKPFTSSYSFCSWERSRVRMGGDRGWNKWTQFIIYPPIHALLSPRCHPQAQRKTLWSDYACERVRFGEMCVCDIQTRWPCSGKTNCTINV